MNGQNVAGGVDTAMRLNGGNVSPVRRLAAGGALICLVSLLIAYFFMQRYLLLAPCPLCILDRFAVAGIGIGCFYIAVFWKGRASVTHWLAWGQSTLFLIAGFVFAGRHIWLQNRPPDESAFCLSDNAAVRGVIDLIGRAFAADADCGAIVWEFGGLTIPEQVLALFVGLALLQGALARSMLRQ